MKDKVRLLFVCLGNICRSPAAQAIMQELIDKAGYSGCVEVDSAGTFGAHAGDLPDIRMRRHAERRGYKLTHRARTVETSDFEKFDFILAMDDWNYEDLHDNLAPDPESQKKIFRMTSFCKKMMVDHVPDPYYAGSDGFEQVLDILEDSCAGLLDYIKRD